MGRIIRRAGIFLLAIIMVVNIPLVAFAQNDWGEVNEASLASNEAIAFSSNVDNNSPNAVGSLEFMLPDIGNTSFLDNINDTPFLGPPGLDLLQERLLLLEEQWRELNEQLLSLDRQLVRQRETARSINRNVRVVEAQQELRNRSAEDGLGRTIVNYQSDIADEHETNDAETQSAQSIEFATLSLRVTTERDRAQLAQERLESSEMTRESVFESLLAIEVEIDQVHEAINAAWNEFDLLHGGCEYGDYYADNESLMCETCEALDYFPDDHDCLCLYDLEELREAAAYDYYYDYDDDYYYEDEEGAYDEPELDYSAYIDAYGDFWYGIEADDYFFSAEAVAFASEIARDAPVFTERMSDTEIDLHATRTTSSPIIIQNSAQLQAFLRAEAPFTDNDGHYELRHTTNPNYVFLLTAATTNQGRPGVFTGIFDGNGHEIRGYRFRPLNNAQSSIGFFQQAGHGAVIRNVNFHSGLTFTNGMSSPTDANSVWLDALGGAANVTWRTAPTDIGTIIGSTSSENAPMDGAVISIDRVRLLGQHEMRQTVGTTAQSTKNIGGMVGTVRAGTTLNLRDVSVQNVTIHAADGGTGSAILPVVRTGGGLVGSIAGGALNVVVSDPTARNSVNVDMRANQRSTSAVPTMTTGIGFGGGVVGFVYSGDVFVEFTTVTSTRMAADPIRVLHVGGGIIGGGNDPRSIMSLYNVINRADVHVNAAGGAHTIFGGAGGLVGRTAGVLHIRYSENFAEVRHQNNNAIVGGLVGESGPASRVFISDSTNHGVLQHLHVGSANARHIRTDNALMGGIIGQSRGGLVIERTHNRGLINKVNANAAANLNTSVGGIAGRIRPISGQAITLLDVSNIANVRSGTTGNGAVGGIIGEIMPWLGAPVAGIGINLTNVTNEPGPSGQVSPGSPTSEANRAVAQGVSGGRHSGGIIGFNRVSGVNITNATNSANIVANTARHAVAGGIVGRASGANLSITDARTDATGATSTGNITANVRDGHAGGIVGRVENVGVSITGSSNAGIISSGPTSGRSTSASGGIVGTITNNGNNAQIADAENMGAILARGRNSVAGGIVGRIAGRNVTITSVLNNSDVTGGTNGRNGRDSAAGGVVGQVLQNGHFLIIQDAQTTTGRTIQVRGNNGNVGGIIGTTAGRNLVIEDATNHSTINQSSAPSTNAGGIVGRLTSGARDSSLTTVRNHGAVTLTSSRPDAGGIVGLASAVNLNITDARNSGTVTTSTIRSSIGGIVGRLNAAGARLENVHNLAGINGNNGGNFTYAGGILGRSTGRNMVISTATNVGRVGGTNATSGTASPRRAGGIVGESSGAGARIFNVDNSGDVIARSGTSIVGAGGIVGRGSGSSTIIDGARNTGFVNAADRPTGGIVGRQRNSNFVIRNASNTGEIRSSNATNANSGTGGIIGRSQGANTRVELSFNSGVVHGGGATGGIIGRTQQTVTIQDFYNIGTIGAGHAWAGHGIIGRQRDTARLTIQRGFVSGRVGGFATLTRQGNNNAAAVGSRPHNNTTLSLVYVDTSALISTSATTAAQLQTAREQTNGNRRATPLLVDTEFLTAGFLPGITGGPWRVGVVDYSGVPVSLDDVRTYPYFYWQIYGGGLQEEFFSHIRMPAQDSINTYLPAMDNDREAGGNALEVLYTFVDWTWEPGASAPVPGPSRFVSGTREFVPSSQVAHFRQVTLSDSATSFRSNTAASPNILPQTLSAGLISLNGVVGFETRELPTRLVVRGFDEIWGADAWVNHADITVSSGCVIEPARINNGLGYISGILVINFEYDGDQIVGVDLDRLAVRLAALGYYTIDNHRIDASYIVGPIGPGMQSQHEVNVPMVRVPFPIRVWVMEPPAEVSEDFDGFPPLGVPVPNSRLIHDLTPNAGADLNPTLDPTREENPPRHPGGYFIIHAMFGDNITGTAPLFSSSTVYNLSFDDLFIPAGPEYGERQPHDQMPDYAGRLVDVMDLHIYIESTALPRMQFHFYEDSDRDASFVLPTRTDMSEDVFAGWYWIPETALQIVIHYDEEFETTPGAAQQARVASTALQNGNTTGNNFRASPSKNMNVVGRNAVLLSPAPEYTRANTIVNPMGTGGIGNTPAARDTLRNLLDYGYTVLQGSNPFLWVGADMGAARIHLDTVFDVICLTDTYYNRYGLRISDFLEENVPDGDEGDTFDDMQSFVARINVGLVPITPEPYDPPYEEPEEVTINIRVYAYRVNADGTGYVYENGNRVRDLVPTAEIQTDAYNLEVGVNVNDEPVFGTFTAVLRNPAHFYSFEATDSEDMLYDEFREINLLEAHPDGDLIWTDGSTLAITLQRPRHNVRFEAGEGGTLSFGTLTEQNSREMELIQGTVLNAPAHVPTTAANANFVFIGWERVIEGGDNIVYGPSPAGHIVTESVVFRARFGPVLTINNLPNFASPYPINQTQSGGREEGEQVVLAHGAPPTDESWEFLGWVRGTMLPAVGTDIGDFTGYVRGEDWTFQMPDSPITYTAIWGYDEIVGRPGVALTIENIPGITFEPLPATQQTASGNRPYNTTVTLAHGTPYLPESNYQFMGWIRADRLPEIGDNLQDWLGLPENAGVMLRNAAWFFNMPSTATTYTAIWGNHGIVGGPAYRITFHIGYYFDFDGTDEHVVVNVAPGDVLNLNTLEALGIPVAHRFGTGTEPHQRGWALWGWFDDNMLATGEARADLDNGMRRGFRRPAVGLAGFDFSTVLTQTFIDDHFDNTGNLDLYIVWSLWGDADDNDVVDGIDVTLISQFVADEAARAINEAMGMPVMVIPHNVVINTIASDVQVNGIINGVDVTLVSQFVADEAARAINEAIGMPVMAIPHNVILGRPE